MGIDLCQYFPYNNNTVFELRSRRDVKFSEFVASRFGTSLTFDTDGSGVAKSSSRVGSQDSNVCISRSRKFRFASSKLSRFGGPNRNVALNVLRRCWDLRKPELGSSLKYIMFLSHAFSAH